MKRRIGILTAGGDCPGLNSTIRAVAKSCYRKFGDEVQLIGIHNGFSGLMYNECTEMNPEDFSGLLTRGGTVLGTRRTPFRMMHVIEEDGTDKVNAMKTTYKKQKLDCIVTLGGNGTHKTASLLSSEGLNVIALPKTIDNDIYGTDVSFGFHTAVETAAGVIDLLHSTAESHKRVIVVEIMGNKAGWLTLSSGVAGGADAIIIPEIPYDVEKISEICCKRASEGKNFSIIAVAEGAMDIKEAAMKKKERELKRREQNFRSISERIADQIQDLTGMETRNCIPGHMLRGGAPSAYDRILSTEFGVHASDMIYRGKYGYTAAIVNGKITENRLSDIAGKPGLVPENHQLIISAESMGISFGNYSK